MGESGEIKYIWILRDQSTYQGHAQDYLGNYNWASGSNYVTGNLFQCRKEKQCMAMSEPQ